MLFLVILAGIYGVWCLFDTMRGLDGFARERTGAPCKIIPIENADVISEKSLRQAK